MAQPLWNIENSQKVEIYKSFMGKARIHVNGQEVARAKTGKKATIPFTIGDKIPAVITITPSFGFDPDYELRVDGQVYLSDKELQKAACRSCGRSVKEKEQFCAKCGAAIPEPHIQRRMIKLRGGRTAILAVSIMFLVFGFIMAGLQQNLANDVLNNIAALDASEIFPEPIGEEMVTVGELRVMIKREPLQIMVINIILSSIMFGLYLYAKRSPLVSLISALAVYYSVIVLNAIVDPTTIGQGLIVKIIVTIVLVNGIRSALELRKVGT